MKKLFAIAVVLVFAMAPMAFAAGVALTDTEMDQIAAGDWIVLTDADGNQTVEDVYASNNTLDLLEDSQVEIQAVNNTNAVDSAVAVSTNIASVTGNPTNNVAVNGSNAANLKNLSPSESEASSSEYANLISETKTEGSAESKDKYERSSSNSSSESGSIETFYNTDLYTSAEATSTSTEADCSKDCTGSSASASAKTVVAFLDIDYVKTNDESSGESSSSSNSLLKTESKSKTTSKEESETRKGSSSSRKNSGENNHLNIEDTSQELLQAVSNLNAVGSGAAVQTNIASNVGVTGTITHLNTASVANGF